MKAYMIVFAKITDPEAFKKYSAYTTKLVSQFGGRYVTIGRQATLLEGSFGEKMSIVISEWPTRNAAEFFWNSPEYQEAKKLREGTGTFNVSLVDDLLPFLTHSS